MDDLARFNKERWEELSAANVDYARPMLDLDAESARQVVDPFSVMGEVQGKDVLCLASGGGQQSVAFGLLGARVTVLDFSENQLERDRQALAHYGLQARLVQGDMRDLSVFGTDAFDLVWHAFSINFVPDCRPVFDQVVKVLRPGGLYRMEWHNPFTMDMDECEWTGAGYPIKHPYVDGAFNATNTYWVIQNESDETPRRIEGPREFNHRLSTVINGLIGRGFVLMGLWEELTKDPDAEPGTWEHYKAFAPPWLTIWARYQP
ncbi:MAG TPA: class I SAM-dependent methyltransferase [Spirillospora sp.]|nr:class I SAM-dependent methyltransferase [Spirillospora sp.]